MSHTPPVAAYDVDLDTHLPAAARCGDCLGINGLVWRAGRFECRDRVRCGALVAAMRTARRQYDRWRNTLAFGP